MGQGVVGPQSLLHPRNKTNKSLFLWERKNLEKVSIFHSGKIIIIFLSLPHRSSYFPIRRASSLHHFYPVLNPSQQTIRSAKTSPAVTSACRMCCQQAIAADKFTAPSAELRFFSCTPPPSPHFGFRISPLCDNGCLTAPKLNRTMCLGNKLYMKVSVISRQSI